MLSEKQRQVIDHAHRPEKLLLAIGAVRSGKTVATCTGYSIWSQACFPHANHIIAGQSVRSVMDNVVEPDGGLFDVLRELGYKPRISQTLGHRIIVPQATGRRPTKYLIFGADDAKARRRIQGLTAAGAFLDEVALTPEDFFMTVWGRLSIPGAKFWGTLNPEGKQHWLKKNVVDKLDTFRGRVVTSRLDDNPSLEDEFKEDLQRALVGHYRERYIEGEWSDASGLVFPVWHKVPVLPDVSNVINWSVGWDWGQSTVTVAVLFAHLGSGNVRLADGTEILARGRKLAWAEHWHDARTAGPRTDEQHVEKLAAFVRAYTNAKIVVYGDPTTPAPVKRLIRKKGIQWTDANNAVVEGIATTNRQLVSQQLLIGPSVPNLERELSEYVWDEKAVEVGEDKPVKKADHACDCYNGDVEVLTRRGWRKFADLAMTDEIATVHLDADCIEFHRPKRLVSYDHHGEMVEVRSKRLRLQVTPNHRMVVYPRVGSAGAGAATVKPASDLSPWDRIKVATANYSGEHREPLTVEGARGKPAFIDPLVWAELLGWYVAEGSGGTPQVPGRGYPVRITQVSNLETLRAVLRRTPWTWSYSGGSFHASSRWLWQQLSPLGQAHEKHVPEWVMRSDQRVIEAFLRGAVAGDGWIERGVRRYATVSRRLADEMQALFLLAGSAATISEREPRPGGAVDGRQIVGRRTQYYVREVRTGVVYLRSSVNAAMFGRVPFDGRVYCAEVPNGAMVVRNDGQPAVCGNSMRYMAATMPRTVGVVRQGI